MVPTMLGIAVAALSLSGCGSGASTLRGSAFGNPPAIWVGLATFPPGTRFSDVYAYLQNTTSGPITLASIHVLGSGIGSVVRVERIAVVPPVRNGNLAVPMTEYETDPPVFGGVGWCHVSLLRRVRGYVLPSHGSIRLYVIFDALRSGRWNSPRLRIDYTMARQEYVESVQTGIGGGVSKAARPALIQSFERPCLNLTTPLIGATR